MINGIHHITALASDPQQNVDFYTGVLGLRLVKRTVNFDAPDVYHLYYGDGIGRPGTILTFFPFPDAARGKRGTGEITAISFSVPKSSIEFWVHRLSSHGIHIDGPTTHFNDELISFLDPDGMMIELVFEDWSSDERRWPGNPIGPEYAIQRIHGSTMQLRAKEQTDRMLIHTLGFKHVSQSGSGFRYSIGEGVSKAFLDLLINPGLPYARQSAGSVHHIAWSIENDESQREWRQNIINAGLEVTEILDRKYFHSIYFREPGGVLFEIATNTPGFTVDESFEQLGSRLILPQRFEQQRAKLERLLPPLELNLKQHVQELNTLS